ncbi:MAG: serine/threonine protein kinase [Phycisphaerales bacterium]|nr:serine/threonine protein kinase [Phycisphaerales bacterium]
MGEVWLAKRLSDGRAVAIKVPKLGAHLGYFAREIECLRSLDHPNIVKYIDDGVCDGPAGPAPYLVMEYVFDARAITHYAWENELGVRERLELFLQVCSAVGHLHGTAKRAHRDLKPENIQVGGLRPKTGEDGRVDWPPGRVKLIDVGIATPVEPDPALFERALEVGAVGTMEYMAPEQFRPGGEALDERTDIYALGVVLHELLTASLPYPPGQQHRPAVREAIVNHRIVGPARVARSMIRAVRKRGRESGWIIRPVECDGELEAIVLRALGKGRGDRFASADAGAGDLDLAVNIRALLAGEPLPMLKGTGYEVATAARARLRTRRWPGSMSKLVYVLALIAAALAGMFTAQLSGVLAPYTEGWQRYVVTAAAPPSSEDSIVIEMTERTDAAAVARFAGLPDLEEAGSMRRVWGRVVEGVAKRGVGVVVIDHFYPTATQFDGDLIRGVQSAKSANRSVVVDGTHWFDDRAAGIEPACELHRHVLWGRAGAETPPNAPWAVQVGLKRGDEVRPSVALVAAMFFRRASSDLTCSLDDRTGEVTLRASDGGSPIRIPASAKEKVTQSGADAKSGVKPGDLLSQYMITIPPKTQIDNRTIDLADYLSRSEEAQTRLVANKIVVLKDTRGTEDSFTYFGRDKIGGWQALASAASQILGGWRLPVHDSLVVEWMLLTGAGAVGVLVMAGVLWAAPIDRALPRRAPAHRRHGRGWAGRAAARWAAVTMTAACVLVVVVPLAALAMSVASRVLYFPHAYTAAAIAAAAVTGIIALARRRLPWERGGKESP